MLEISTVATNARTAANNAQTAAQSFATTATTNAQTAAQDFATTAANNARTAAQDFATSAASNAQAAAQGFATTAANNAQAAAQDFATDLVTSGTTAASAASVNVNGGGITNAGTVSGVTAATTSDQAVNFGQLQAVFSQLVQSGLCRIQGTSVSCGVTNASNAAGQFAVAVGNNATATHDNSVAIGNGSQTSAANTVSVGATGAERRITSVAAGASGTDAVNLAQLSNAIAGLSPQISAGRDYTDQQIALTNARTDDLVRSAREYAARGIAASSALPTAVPREPARPHLTSAPVTTTARQQSASRSLTHSAAICC